MTSVIRRAAGGATLLEAVLGAYLLSLTSAPYSCPLSGCPMPYLGPLYWDALAALTLALFVVGLIGAWGAFVAYRAGLALSVFFFLMMGMFAWTYSMGPYPASWTYAAAAGGALGVIGIVTNFLATRREGGISEQANPMNLPVFG